MLVYVFILFVFVVFFNCETKLTPIFFFSSIHLFNSIINLQFYHDLLHEFYFGSAPIEHGAFSLFSSLFAFAWSGLYFPSQMNEDVFIFYFYFFVSFLKIILWGKNPILIKVCSVFFFLISPVADPSFLLYLIVSCGKFLSFQGIFNYFITIFCTIWNDQLKKKPCLIDFLLLLVCCFPTFVPSFGVCLILRPLCCSAWMRRLHFSRVYL